MSGAATTSTATDQLGVVATWRATPGQVKALLAGVFVNKFAGFIQIFLVLFLTNRGFSQGQAGLALGLYGAGAVLGTLVGGWASDRLSARTATLISMVGSALLIVSIIYAHYYLLILLAVLLVSAVGQLYRPAAQSLITELTPQSRLVMVTAMYRLCLNLGTTVAPLIGVALASVSYNLLFWGEALAALVYSLIALFFLPREGERAEPAADAPAVAERLPARERSSYRAVFADARYLTFLVAFLLMCLVYCQYIAVLPLAVAQAGLSTWWYGAVITINGAIVITFEVAATRFTQRWPIRLTQFLGFILLAAGYGVYALGVVPVFLVLGTLVWTSSEIIGAPTVWAYPGVIAPGHLRGRYFGAMQSTYGLATAVGPIVGIALFASLDERFFLWATGVAVVATVINQVALRPASTAGPEPVAAEPAT